MSSSRFGEQDDGCFAGNSLNLHLAEAFVEISDDGTT